MNYRFKRNIIVLIILTVIVSFFFFFAIKHVHEESELVQESYSQYNVINGTNYKQNDDLTLILFAGLDSQDNNVTDSYRNNELSDCLVLLVLDKTNKTILPIQINRDTMATYDILGIGGKYAGESYGQIALAHSYGSGGMDSLVNTKNAVSELLCDINIDYYFSLPMKSVAVLNDAAGGVEVYIEDDFTGIDDTLIQGQTCLIMGDSALTFVRARSEMDDSSNIARMERQRVYLRALFEKCSEIVKQDSNFSQEALNSVSEYLICNTNTYGLSDIMNTLLGYELLDSVKLEGEARVGETYMEFYVDEAKLENFCIETFFREVK